MSDLISRADAIEAVCRDCSIETKNNCKEEGYCYEVQNLKALPSANVIKFDFNKYQPRVRNKVNDGTLLVEAVQGEWKRVGHDIYECSICHQNIMTKDIDCYSYCHRCGSRMKGGAE